MSKVFIRLLSLVVFFSSSLAALAADFPNGYLVYSTYAGGKMETVGFKSLEITNQYGGSIKTEADRDLAYAAKMVVVVVCLNIETSDGMNPKMGGANATFMRSKMRLADLAATRSRLEDLQKQKKDLDALIEAQGLKGPLEKVSEALAATITRVQEAAKNAPAAAATDPKDTEFTFVTTSGDVIQKVRVTAVTEQGVNLSMENGLSRVAIDKIPSGAKQFPEPWRAEIVKQQDAITHRAAAEKKRVADEAQKAAEEKAAKAAEEAAKAAPPKVEVVEEPKASGAPAEAPKK